MKRILNKLLNLIVYRPPKSTGLVIPTNVKTTVPDGIKNYQEWITEHGQSIDPNKQK